MFSKNNLNNYYKRAVVKVLLRKRVKFIFLFFYSTVSLDTLLGHVIDFTDKMRNRSLTAEVTSVDLICNLFN